MKNTNNDFSKDDFFYKSIYENILDAVFYTVPDGRILYANRAACSLFGMTIEEFNDRGRDGILDTSDPRLEMLLQERRTTGKTSGELVWIRKDGSKFPAACSSSVFKIGNGEERTCIVIHDLTEIRKVEADLRKSKDAFRSYFEYGPVAMCVNTPDNKWSEINQEFCRLLGYDKDELLSMNWEQITHPDDVAANKALIRKVEVGEIDHFKLDKRYIRKDGQILYMTLSLVATRNPDGSINHVVVSFIDNTDQFKAVENLVQERHLLRTLVDNLPFPIYFIDKEGRKVIANKADMDNIGCMDEIDVLGKTDEALFPNEVGKRGHADNMNVLRTGKPILDREEDFVNIKGEQRWLQTTKIPLFDANHQISGLVGIGLDVTQQRLLKDKIKESEAYYRSLVNVSPDGIIVTDLLGIIDFVSYKVYEIFGIPESLDLVGDSIFKWIAPDHLEFAKSSFSNVINDDIKASSQEFMCRKYDGTIFWGESASTLLEDSNGNNKGTMIVFRDITDRKKAEEEILLAKNKAEESDRLKSAFLQNISHEIRTPMNSIMGFLEILEDPNFSRNEKKLYANIVHKSGHRLLNTIHDIIEISKIMTSNVELNYSRVDMVNFVQNHYDSFKPSMEEKGLEFKLDCSLDSLVIQTDELKLAAVLNKLLENACKFTNEGHVLLSVKQQEDQLIFKVQDSGIGIEPEKLTAIFQPFYQTDHAYTRRHEGAGLGLTISKAYVEMLGGTIRVESNLETGTTVVFQLPILKASPNPK
jgi:PAS domain S-box-containing protein